MTMTHSSLLHLLEGEAVQSDFDQALEHLAKLEKPSDVAELEVAARSGPALLRLQERIPYMAGARGYSDHFGTREQEVKRYRSSLTISIATNVLLAGALVMLALSARVAPYIVQIDKTGFTVPIGPAERVDAADERVLIAYTANWVRALRTVLDDKDSQRALVKTVFSMLGSNTVANRKAREWLTEQNVLGTGLRRVNVEIQRIAPLESGKAFTVEWIEREFMGAASGTESLYSALVTLSISPVQRLDEIVSNPLGIFVTDYSISKIR